MTIIFRSIKKFVFELETFKRYLTKECLDQISSLNSVWLKAN